jgi:MarR family transcriptional regulator, organic hydroperoxide resistance regulator
MSIPLEKVCSFWIKVLGIHGSQWMILMALQRLDQGQGASAQAIAEVLHMNLSFVTSQSRLLETKGLIWRKAAGDDHGAMMLSLTEKARHHLVELASPKPD